jgi:hypothetical protein
MKKIVLILTVFISNLCFSQTTGTTIEEFNYLTKGYKIQIESGLDMKKGYTLNKYPFPAIVNYNSGDKSAYKRETEFYILYRDNDKYPAAFLFNEKRSDTGHNLYYCIPNTEASKEIKKLSFDFFSNNHNDYTDSAKAYHYNTLVLLCNYISSFAR